MPNGATLSLVVQWDEPWGARTTDLDSFLVNANGGALATTSDDFVASGPEDGGIPLNYVTWTNHTGSPVAVGLRILRASGTRSPLIKYMAIPSNFYMPGISEYPSAVGGAIAPDAASAEGAVTVAAVPAGLAGRNLVEWFSSRGPVNHVFDQTGSRLATPLVLNKPDVAGADAVTTGVPGFAPFAGTSAAAPHVAGVAALTWSANPSLSADQIASIITDPANATPCLVASDCGSGFVLADRTVAAAKALASASTDWRAVVLAHGGAWSEASSCSLYTFGSSGVGRKATYSGSSGCDYTAAPTSAPFTWTVNGSSASLAFAASSETLSFETYNAGTDLLGFTRPGAPADFDGCTSSAFPAALKASVTCAAAGDPGGQTSATDTPDPTDTATPSPTATETPSPTATATDTPSPTATATETPSPTATATETPSPTATATETPSPTATATETPSPTATATETPSADADGDRDAEPDGDGDRDADARRRRATETPSPTPTATPTVEPTPTPTPTSSRRRRRRSSRRPHLRQPRR